MENGLEELLILVDEGELLDQWAEHSRKMYARLEYLLYKYEHNDF